MTESELQTKWPYPLLSVSEDRRASRVAVPVGMASELVGVDGNCESGLRPFPGLKIVRELQPKVLTAGSPAKNSYTGRAVVIDCFAVDFSVSADGYGYGFVYRIKKDPNYATEVGAIEGVDDADVFIDFWSSHPPAGAVGGWSDGNTFDNRVVQDCSSTAPMSVTVSANGMIYVHIRGRGPALCYQDKETPYALLRIGDSAAPFPGPGLRPTLLAPENGTVLGGVAVIDDVNRCANGQVWLGTTLPSATALGLTQADTEPRMMDGGAYAFAYQLYDSNTGRRSALSEIAWANAADFTADPSFFVLELLYDSNKFDQAYVYRSVRVQDAGGTYVATYLHLERIITLTDYESNLAVAYPFKHSVYYYVLEDKALVYQDYFQDQSLFDEVMPRGGAALMYGNTLLVSRISGGDPSSTEESRPDDALRGLGEIRYSSLTDVSPELFPASNRYVPKTPSNEVISFAQVGDGAVGWSLDRQYFIRKEGQYIRIVEVHQGFGITGPKAVDVVGSTAYFLTHKGLKAVDANSQLEDIKAFNQVIMEEWGLDDRADVSVAFDAALSCLFVHNPAAFQTLCLWFNTGKASELLDMAFTQVFRGPWPDEGSGNLVDRVFFLQDCPDHSTSDEFLPDWRPRVYIVDKDRSKTGWFGAYGAPPNLLLDIGGDAVFETTADAAGGIVEVSGTLPVSPEGAMMYVLDSPDASFIGMSAQIYYMPTASQFSVGGPGVDQSLDGLPTGSTVGISPIYLRWVGHPLDNRATTDQGSFAQGIDFHRIKQVSSLECAFTDVSGDESETTNAKYRGLCYRGSDEDPLDAVPPVGSSAGGSVGSVINREGRNAAYFRDSDSDASIALGVVGNCLCPGVEIFCPNLDYRLVSVRVTGKLLGTSRSRNSS